jgi:cytochrome c oxidase subunit IV
MSTEHAHVASKRSYFAIFAILLVCTYLTWQVAFFDLGPLNTVVALGIAVFKAVLVVLFFMHVRHGARLTWVVILAAVFWLVLLLGVTMSDYLTRGWR